MKNKKGFTLIELLAVIAILAILVVIAVPTVLQLFKEAKENTFRTQAQQIFKAAEQQHMSDNINGTAPGIYCVDSAAGTTGETPLNLSGNKNLYYSISFSNDAITSFTIYDNTYGITLTTFTIDAIKEAELVTGDTELTALAFTCGV